MDQGSPPPSCPTLDDDFLDLSLNDSNATTFNALTLIGFVVSDKVINFKAIKNILLNVWNFGTPIQTTHLDRNKFVVSFTSEESKAKVLVACPWAIKGHILLLQQWNPSYSLEELTFCYTPFWIQIHNIPLNRMNVDNTRRFGAYIGEYLCVDEAKLKSRLCPYLRIHAQIDISKSLKSGTFIRNEDGSSRWLPFKYEHLSDFCFTCGKLGHTMTGCQLVSPPSFGAMDPRHAYGHWMRAFGHPASAARWFSPPVPRQPHGQSELPLGPPDPAGDLPVSAVEDTNISPAMCQQLNPNGLSRPILTHFDIISPQAQTFSESQPQLLSKPQPKLLLAGSDLGPHPLYPSVLPENISSLILQHSLLLPFAFSPVPTYPPGSSSLSLQPTTELAPQIDHIPSDPVSSPPPIRHNRSKRLAESPHAPSPKKCTLLSDVSLPTPAYSSHLLIMQHDTTTTTDTSDQAGSVATNMQSSASVIADALGSPGMCDGLSLSHSPLNALHPPSGTFTRRRFIHIKRVARALHTIVADTSILSQHTLYTF